MSDLTVRGKAALGEVDVELGRRRMARREPQSTENVETPNLLSP